MQEVAEWRGKAAVFRRSPSLHSRGARVEGEKKHAGGGKGVRAARGGKIFLFSFAGNKFITYICTFQILKAMPTIFILFGFRFMFYANDHEPIHVHVVKGDIRAKFSLNPVSLVENHGLKPAELKMVEAVIEENREIIAEHWNKFFNSNK